MTDAHVNARQTDAQHDGVDGACGKCGYGVYELESLICPECGSDLRAVGIVVGRARRWNFRKALPYLLWTLFIFAVGYSVTIPLFQYVLPSRFDRMVRREIDCRVPQLKINLEANQFGSVWVRGMSLPSSVPMESMNIHIQGTLPRIWVRLRDGAYSIDSSNGLPTPMGGIFGSSALLAYFRQMGFNSNDPAVQQGVAEIMFCLNQPPSQTILGWQTPHITANLVSTWDNHVFAPWIECLAIAAWTVVWIVGIVVIRRRGAR